MVSQLSWHSAHTNVSYPTLEFGSSPASPLNCLLGQHSVASQKCHSAQDSQVLQGLEHVELSPVDIHEPQHCYKKCHDIQLKGAVTVGREQGAFCLTLLSQHQTTDDNIFAFQVSLPRNLEVKL